MVGPICQAPPVKGGAEHDCFGGWSRISNTLTTALAQPQAMPRLVALHIGAEALAVIAMGVRANG